jgi:hypothetical protein
MIIFIAVDTMTAIDGPNMNKEIIVVLKIDQPETLDGHRFNKCMKKDAVEKQLFRLVQKGTIFCIYSLDDVERWHVLEEWIEPAPEHLVVAARLRGEI